MLINLIFFDKIVIYILILENPLTGSIIISSVEDSEGVMLAD